LKQRALETYIEVMIDKVEESGRIISNKMGGDFYESV